MKKQQDGYLLSEKFSVIRQAQLLLGLVVISVVLGFIYSAWSARNDQLVDTHIAAANISQAVAQHAEDMVTKADMILLGMVERTENAHGDVVALARLHSLLAARLVQVPQIQGLVIFDESGERISSALDAAVDNLNSADREYFLYHKNNPGRGPHIGVPLRSRLTHEWNIPISRRIEHTDGSFAGVALATITLDSLKRFYQKFDLGASGSILLSRSDGRLLMRLPYIEEVIGKDIRSGPLFNNLVPRGHAGEGMWASPVDQIERIYSFRNLDMYPLLVAASLSKHEALADWYETTLRQAAAVLVLLALLLLLGVRLIVHIGHRNQAEAALLQVRSELLSANQTLTQIALQDGLTGISNRRHFDAMLEAEFSRASRYGSGLALLIIDVDHFKRYNDMYGHPAGDECLKKIAAVLCMDRPADLSARYGGEEFAIILPGIGLEGALVVGEKIRNAIKQLHILHAGNETGVVTVSIGLDMLAPGRNSDSAAALLAAADKALYFAKEHGRDRVHAAVHAAVHTTTA